MLTIRTYSNRKRIMREERERKQQVCHAHTILYRQGELEASNRLLSRNSLMSEVGRVARDRQSALLSMSGQILGIDSCSELQSSSLGKPRALLSIPRYVLCFIVNPSNIDLVMHCILLPNQSRLKSVTRNQDASR